MTIDYRAITARQQATWATGDFNELARQIIRMSGSRSEVVFRPLPTDDPKVRQPDITKARRLLAWEPKVEVEDGLRRTIDWCRKLVAQP